MRGDWKRKYFVLDNHGSLFYYRSKGPKPAVGVLFYICFTSSDLLMFFFETCLQGFQSYNYSRSSEQNSGMFGRFRSRHNRAASLNEDILGCYAVDLCTSTIKMDADDTDLRLCFRIISPAKTYTLQVTDGLISYILNESYNQPL